MKKNLFAFCCLFFILHLHELHATIIRPTIPTTVYDIINYGATTTSVNNTTAIQKAIDVCSAAGGGIVNIPSGTYLCGPLSLKTKVNLQISEGAILKLLPFGSGNGVDAGSYPNNGTANNYNPLIYANKVDNVKISGKGMIDGNGADWWAAYLSSKAAGNAIGRPGVIRIENCNFAEISNITIINAPNVHMTVKNGTNTTLQNVTVNSPYDSPNTDGLDTWGPYIDVLNCTFNCGDDNIAMDSNSHHITIKNCFFGTGHGCSIGSYAGNINNIIVDSCTFSGTGNGARFKSSRDRGGVEEYITYSNCTMINVDNPFFLSSYYPKEPNYPTSDTTNLITVATPRWRHINFKNITVTGALTAGTIWGLPEIPITDVVFDNVKISGTSYMKVYNVKDLVFKNGSTISVTSKKSGAVIDNFNSSISGLNIQNGLEIQDVKQTIYLNRNDDIVSILKAQYNGTSPNVELIIPAGYINPSPQLSIDFSTISSTIQTLILKGDGTNPSLIAKQINLPSLSSIKFVGLQFKGVENNEIINSTTNSNYLLYPSTTGLFVGEVLFDGCTIQNYYGAIRISNLGSGAIPYIGFNNCIIRNLGGYGFLTLGSSNYSHSGTVSIQNSTFYNIEASIIYAKYTSNLMIKIANCTFDNILTGSNTLVYGSSTTTMNFENNILGKSVSSSSNGFVSCTTLESNSYKTSEWVNSTNSTSALSLYTNNTSSLFTQPATFTTPISSPGIGNYLIKDINFIGKTSAGDPRWYYGNILSVIPKLKNQNNLIISNHAIHFSEYSFIEIYTVDGQLVSMKQDALFIPLPNSGIYIVKVTNRSGSSSHKIVI